MENFSTKICIIRQLRSFSSVFCKQCQLLWVFIFKLNQHHTQNIKSFIHVLPTVHNLMDAKSHQKLYCMQYVNLGKTSIHTAQTTMNDYVKNYALNTVRNRCLKTRSALHDFKDNFPVYHWKKERINLLKLGILRCASRTVNNLKEPLQYYAYLRWQSTKRPYTECVGSVSLSRNFLYLSPF